MIKHIVLFKYKTEAPAAQRKEMEDRLNALPELISEVKNWHWERSIPGRPARSFHVALICEFADSAALDRYIANPHHQACVPLIEAACETRSAFDYE